MAAKPDEVKKALQDLLAKLDKYNHLNLARADMQEEVEAARKAVAS